MDISSTVVVVVVVVVDVDIVDEKTVELVEIVIDVGGRVVGGVIVEVSVGVSVAVVVTVVVGLVDVVKGTYLVVQSTSSPRLSLSGIT